jgi:hypothetical protein
MNTRTIAVKERPLFGSQVPAQKPTTLENVHSWLKLISEIVSAVVITTTVASGIIGILIIGTYLSNFTIPISPIDTLSVSSFQLFMVFFIAILVGVVVFLFTPLTAPYLWRVRHERAYRSSLTDGTSHPIPSRPRPLPLSPLVKRDLHFC